MTPVPISIVLRHGTTLRRATAIAAFGPDPDFREPGAGPRERAEGFSCTVAGALPCLTGTPDLAARRKAALFRDEGGPAIVEVEVPPDIMAAYFADPIAADLARGGEIRFEPESGLTELRAAWPRLKKRVIVP